MSKSEFKKEIDRIEVPEKSLDMMIGEAMKKGRPEKGTFGRKLAYLSGAAALFLCLLFGSAFVSPAMADAFARIPILGSVFQLGEPGQDILDELQEQGYNVTNVSFNYEPEKEVEIRVGGSDDYISDVKGDIRNIAEDILKSNHYDAYTVKVTETWQVEPEPENKPEPGNGDEQLRRITDTVYQALQKINYKHGFQTIGYFFDTKTIKIPIQGSETYYNKIKANVKNTVNQVLEEENFEGYTVKVPWRPTEAVKTEKWKLDLMPYVYRELMGKKDYHVTDIRYSMEKNKMQLNIQMSLEDSDPEAKKIAERIKQKVTKILESKRFEAITTDFPYEINVYGKHHEKIH